jgi:hypothetical protein
MLRRRHAEMGAMRTTHERGLDAFAAEWVVTAAFAMLDGAPCGSESGPDVAEVDPTSAPSPSDQAVAVPAPARTGGQSRREVARAGMVWVCRCAC